MNKVAFITGASRGIGRETALAFARAGFDLAISARSLDEGKAMPTVCATLMVRHCLAV